MTGPRAGWTRARAVTAGELRQALAKVPDGSPVMVIVDGHGAAWLSRARHDKGAGTVDLLAGLGALNRDDEEGFAVTLDSIDEEVTL